MTEPSSSALVVHCNIKLHTLNRILQSILHSTLHSTLQDHAHCGERSCLLVPREGGGDAHWRGEQCSGLEHCNVHN